MRIRTRLICAVAAIGLHACLETQTAPDLPEMPSEAFTLTDVVTGLESPWGIAVLPGDGYLVTGKFGQLWRVSGKTATPIPGLPETVTALKDNRIATDGQGGLLDVALSNDFAQSGEVYLSYSYGGWDANGTALLRARLDGDRLVDAQTLFEAGPAKAAGSHYGGRIVVLPDDTLLLSLGDGFALREEAQKTGSHLGAVVRLTRDGDAAPGNPDFGANALPELYTIGHRNVQGLTYDAQTNTVWEHEHGPRGGDELNRLTPGANYGWPIVTTGVDYQGARITPLTTDSRFEDPVHDWVPSIAPSGLAVYRGAMFTDWDGHALIGGLASGDIRRVDPDTGVETILLSNAKTDEDPFRVRDIAVDRDGSVLILIESKTDGRLIRLTP